MGLNRFADVTPEEFASTYLTSTPMVIESVDSSVVDSRRNLQVTVTVVDWVAAGKVSPVKDMLPGCGVSWIFSVTAAIESGYLIKNGTAVNISEQQILDCTPGNCTAGGAIFYPFNMSMNIGVMSTSAYIRTYLANDSHSCYTGGGTGGPIKITNYTTVSNTNCASFASALINRPLPVFVDGTNWLYY